MPLSLHSFACISLPLSLPLPLNFQFNVTSLFLRVSRIRAKLLSFIMSCIIHSFLTSFLHYFLLKSNFTLSKSFIFLPDHFFLHSQPLSLFPKIVSFFRFLPFPACSLIPFFFLRKLILSLLSLSLPPVSISIPQLFDC